MLGASALCPCLWACVGLSGPPLLRPATVGVSTKLPPVSADTPCPAVHPLSSTVPLLEPHAAELEGLISQLREALQALGAMVAGTVSLERWVGGCYALLRPLWAGALRLRVSACVHAVVCSTVTPTAHLPRLCCSAARTVGALEQHAQVQAGRRPCVLVAWVALVAKQSFACMGASRNATVLCSVFSSHPTRPLCALAPLLTAPHAARAAERCTGRPVLNRRHPGPRVSGHALQRHLCGEGHRRP